MLPDGQFHSTFPCLKMNTGAPIQRCSLKTTRTPFTILLISNRCTQTQVHISCYHGLRHTHTRTLSTNTHLCAARHYYYGTVSNTHTKEDAGPSLVCGLMAIKVFMCQLLMDAELQCVKLSFKCHLVKTHGKLPQDTNTRSHFSKRIPIPIQGYVFHRGYLERFQICFVKHIQ